MADGGTKTAQIEPLDESRRSAIIRLLETNDEGLPTPTRIEHTTPGFVNEPRSRTCPDCLANGRVTFGCSTCKGSGEVTVKRLAEIAVPDALPGDGDQRDPYEVNNTTTAFKGTPKLGHIPERDAEIDRARALGRDRPASELEAAGEATPHPWERERAAMWRRFDYAALNRALETLRQRSPDLAAILVAVYTVRICPACRGRVEDRPSCGTCRGTGQVSGLIEPSTTLEARVELALRFVDVRMPAQIRAPGHENKHPAQIRRDKRRAA